MKLTTWLFPWRARAELLRLDNALDIAEAHRTRECTALQAKLDRATLALDAALAGKAEAEKACGALKEWISTTHGIAATLAAKGPPKRPHDILRSKIRKGNHGYL